MSAYNTRFITPPKEEEDIYPYRRVWRSLVIESGLLVVITGGVFVLFGLFGLAFPSRFLGLANVALALLPAILWVIFSRLGEERVQRPRQQLTTTFVMGALVAGAVGMPIVDEVIRADQWLPLQSVINRIIGYTATLGVVQEILKFAVIRYMIWTAHTQTRADMVAYGAAVAVGWVTAFNLRFALENLAQIDVMALRVLGATTLSMGASLIVGHGLAQTWLMERPNIFLMPASVISAALVVGIGTSLGTSLANATLRIQGAVTRPLFSFVFAVVFWLAVAGLAFFLYNVAERSERLSRGEE
jgi:RsiW-degrading membrane proteinase PrsW (M82 family)